MRVFGKLTYLIPVLTVALWPIAGAQACSGCGCRGGPGYRGPNGRCVGWSDSGGLAAIRPARDALRKGRMPALRKRRNLGPRR
jgi:hypothetical protein